MHKRKEVFEATTDSRVYKLVYRDILDNECEMCGRCRPNRGCNRGWKYPYRNWKYYRNTQYK